MSDNQIVNIEDATIFHHFKTILNNVNFQLKIGEFAYIIGETGSGKSSLLRTIYSDIPLKMGKIIVDGQDISNIKKNQLPYLRRKIGIIFQDFQLFQDRNAYENIKFVMTSTGWSDEKKIDNRITQLLEKVGLENKKNSYPFELSGGEQQRLVIARAIVNNPKLIIADEPTGNLDPLVAEKILKLLLDINKSGTSVIMTTHNYNLIRKYKKRILKCENGYLKEATI
ncbi:MAG: ATP-binding cassette domain-containing protein [Bacteroidota bacterium]|nr:ATP-binding cassette domain-containing protein [Bacteroidota bacterium]MEC8222073.1 ATP-binding cassette domain-containing protein [Bacteroidota bacterium]|tara:strand:+ start:310 stop:987 length:678 start_codon:yes stop_codon:yes gene_type:complete